MKWIAVVKEAGRTPLSSTPTKLVEYDEVREFGVERAHGNFAEIAKVVDALRAAEPIDAVLTDVDDGEVSWAPGDIPGHRLTVDYLGRGRFAVRHDFDGTDTPVVFVDIVEGNAITTNGARPDGTW